MGKYRLTKEELASIAIKYKSKKEFREKEPYAYNSILHRGLLKELCGHMENFGVLRSNEELAAIASNYFTLKEFREKEVAAYSLITLRGLLKELCGHMKRGTISYTDKELEERASKYDDLKEFRKKEKRAYAQICARGLRKKLCGNMKSYINHRTDEEIAEIALKYHYREDFIKNDGPAYGVARKRGILDKVCSHMEWKRKPHGYWTKERCHEEAQKYKTRKEFSKANKAAVAAASRQGWLDEICSHMKPVGNWFKRKIYAFTFTDGYAYVGLAQDPASRYKQHTIRDKRSPVLKHIEKTGSSFEYTILTDWVHKDIAGKIEDDFIEKYKAEGWKMLNTQKGGNLGTLSKFYTKERLQAEADKYDYIDDFRESSPRFYYYITAHHVFEEFCSKMKPGKSSRLYWTLERAISVVPECKGRLQLHNKYPKAWELLKAEGLLDKYYPLLQVNGPHKVWTLEKSISIVSQFKSRSELADKHLSAYKMLRDAGLLDKFFPHKWKAYSNEEKKEILANSNSRKEVREKHLSVYRWAKGNGLLDEFFPSEDKEREVNTPNEKEIQMAVDNNKNREDLRRRHRRVYNSLKNTKRLNEFLPPPKGRTTEEKIKIITNCKTCTELYKKHAGIYRWAKREGILDKYLPPVHKRRTDEERMEILKNCKSRHELNNKYLAVYNWAKERGLLDEYLPVYQKYTDDERMNIIKSSSSRSELYKKSTSAYNWLRDNGLLEEYFPTLRKIYTDEDRIALMKTCRTRTELNEKYRFIYIWAKKNGLLDKYLPQRKANK